MNSRDRKIAIGVLLFSAFIIIAIGIVFGLASVKASSKGDKKTDVQTPASPTAPTSAPITRPGTGNGEYKNGAVATDAGKCSEVGRDILKRGGSAVDAAVSAVFCIGVVNMHSAGIGGGGFMLVYQKSKNFAETLDFREEAPKMATQDMFQNISSVVGGMSTGIPGEVRGLYWAHTKYGKLEWNQLVQPSIDLARNGFPLPLPVYEALTAAVSHVKADPGLKKLFFDGNQMKQVGDIIRNPELASTLEKIRDDPNSFYTGSLADEVARDIQRANGTISKDDLQNYKPKWKAALEGDFSSSLGFYTTAPPSSGAVINLILNILKGYKMTEKDLADDKSSALTYHRIIEAFKYAYAWRARLGDPEFNTTETISYANINEILKNMTSPSFAEQLRLRIEDNRTYHSAEHYGSNYDAGTGLEGTSHLSVLAPNGDAVSVTSTINYRFGAKYRSLDTGIIYNNQMDDFSTPGKPNGFGVRPSPSNFIKPGKRPMSSMCPVIFVRKSDKTARLVAGASGGTYITTAISLVAMNNLWFGMPINQAVNHPRVHNQLSNTTYEVREDRYELSPAIRKGLLDRGNYLRPSSTYAVVQAISKEDQADIYAHSDPRKYGWAAGL